ncbi:MAG TPA: hypothetical protein VGF82_22995 [Terracidiphilus sp.]|jgi:F0F1-type ATP synthase membrane subunit c/vacuolar-type H+-ATPase subunit K
MRKIPLAFSAVSALLLLSGCVTAPNGPSFEAMPGHGKSMQAFDADESACEQYADDRVAGRVKQANDEQTRNTVIGTALGVGLGAAVGNTQGAIVGGAAGAAIGGNANDPGWKQMSIQRQYDYAYAQCMQERGNDVPGPGYGPPRGGYGPPPPPPGYGPPPPPPPHD